MTDEEKKQQLIKDYIQTFEPRAGQNVLADLKNKSKVLFATIPIGNDGKLDSYKMAYENGQRSVLVHIYAQLRKDPYAVKQTKAINERENEDG